MTSLDRAQCLARLSEARVGRLATVTVDLTPHIVPCCFAVIDRPVIDSPAIDSPVIDGAVVDGAQGATAVYSAVDGKPKSTMALRRLDNIGANPAAALIVDHYADDWQQLWWVRADGPAAIVDLAEERELALAALADKYQQYRDRPPDGPVLRIDVARLSGWSFA